MTASNNSHKTFGPGDTRCPVCVWVSMIQRFDMVAGEILCENSALDQEHRLKRCFRCARSIKTLWVNIHGQADLAFQRKLADPRGEGGLQCGCFACLDQQPHPVSAAHPRDGCRGRSIDLCVDLTKWVVLAGQRVA